MELKSSPGRLLVASDPVIGGVNPRQVHRELSFQTAAPTPIGCPPSTHISIRTDSELSEREMDSPRKLGWAVIVGLAQTKLQLRTKAVYCVAASVYHKQPYAPTVQSAEARAVRHRRFFLGGCLPLHGPFIRSGGPGFISHQVWDCA